MRFENIMKSARRRRAIWITPCNPERSEGAARGWSTTPAPLRRSETEKKILWNSYGVSREGRSCPELRCACTGLSILYPYEDQKSNSLVSKHLVSNSLVSKRLVSNSLVSKHLVSKCLVSKCLVSNNLVSNSLVSKCFVSNSLVSKCLVSNSLVSNNLVSKRLKI